MNISARHRKLRMLAFSKKQRTKTRKMYSKKCEGRGEGFCDGPAPMKKLRKQLVLCLQIVYGRLISRRTVSLVGERLTDNAIANGGCSNLDASRKRPDYSKI